MFVRQSDLAVIALLLLALAVLQVSGLDHALMGIYYDAHTKQFPLRHHWLTEDVVHTGGRQLMFVFGLAIITMVLVTNLTPRLSHLRRQAWFVMGSVVLSVMTINLVKRFSGIECPYDLAEFGGDSTNQLTHLFNRPGVGCWPAGHASGPISLVAFYFAFQGSNPRFAQRALVVAIGLGLLFGVAQNARGAHFPSHTLWTILFIWIINATLLICVGVTNSPGEALINRTFS